MPKVKQPLKNEKPDQMHIWMIIDKSGSMQPRISDTIGGFNAYLQDRKDESSQIPTYMSTVLFDDNVEVLYVAKPVEEVEPLDTSTYRIGGSTALYDAINTTLTRNEELIVDKISEEETTKVNGNVTVVTKTITTQRAANSKVLVVIISDGQENASRQTTRDNIKAMIEERTGRGNFTFTYIGADFDAMTAGGAIGISSGNTARGNVREINAIYRAASKATTCYAMTDSLQSQAFYSPFTTPDGMLISDEDDKVQAVAAPSSTGTVGILGAVDPAKPAKTVKPRSITK